MNVTQIMNRVKRQFGDESGVQVTDSDIIDWVNHGMSHIVETNEQLLEKIGTTDLVANQQEYNFPADMLILQTVTIKPFGYTVYSKLHRFSFTEFNMKVDGWDTSTPETGVPTMYSVFENQIILWPVPQSASTAGLKIFYNRTPTAVTGGADTPEIPVAYHNALVDYCLQKAFEMDEDFEAVGVKAGELDNKLANLRGRGDWKGQDVYPSITSLPEDDDGWYL